MRAVNFFFTKWEAGPFSGLKFIYWIVVFLAGSGITVCNFLDIKISSS